MAWPSTSARSKDWGTEVLTDADLENEFDLLHAYINDMMNSSSGHKHDGTTSEGPKILLSNTTIASGAQGDIFHNGATPARLAAGTSGYFLQTQGAAADPVWAAAGPTQAVQADIEAETNEDTYIPPDLLKHHPGIAKCWAYVTYSAGTPSVQASYNLDGVTPIVDEGTGDITFNWGTDFSSANYAIVVTPNLNSTDPCAFSVKAQAAGSCRIIVGNVSGTPVDPVSVSVSAFGDQ